MTDIRGVVEGSLVMPSVFIGRLKNLQDSAHNFIWQMHGGRSNCDPLALYRLAQLIVLESVHVLLTTFLRFLFVVLQVKGLDLLLNSYDVFEFRWHFDTAVVVITTSRVRSRRTTLTHACRNRATTQVACSVQRAIVG